MAPLLRRLPRALAVAVLAALVCGVLVGVANASGGEPAMPKSIAIPMPQAGDAWTYQAVLGGAWQFGENDTMAVGTPFTYGQFKWLDPGLIRDETGAEVAVDRLDARMMHYWPYQGYDRFSGGHHWTLVNETMLYALGTPRGIAQEEPINSHDTQGGGRTTIGSTPLLPPLVETWQLKQVTGTSRSFYGADDGCMARTAIQGTVLSTGKDLDPHDALVPPEQCMPQQDFSVGDAQSFQDLMSLMAERGAAPWHAKAAEEVAGHAAVRYESGPYAVWLTPDLPVPAQIRFTGDDQSIVLTLSSWRSGSGVLGAQGPTPSASPAPPVVLAPRQPWGPDDSGVDHPFPASAAYKAALADPGYAGLRDWLKAHPKGATFLLESKSGTSNGWTVRSWLFSLSDGTSTKTFLETQKTMPGLPVPPQVTATDEGWLDQIMGFLAPDPDHLPKELPTVASEMARWRAYEASEGRPGDGNGWAMATYCLLSCQFNVTTVSAGKNPVALWDMEGDGTTVNLPLPEERTFDGSQLDVGADGLTRALTHWTGFASSGTRVAGLSPRGVVDPSPSADAKGDAGLALATFVPTQGQAAAVGMVATLVGLLYWLWPTLKHGPLLGLFSRLGGPELLEHPSRANLVQIVQAEPGIHFQDLVRRSGLPNGTAVHHLAKLTKAGLLSARPLGRYTCYFLGSSPDRVALAQAPALRSDGARKVYELIQASPGLSGLELASRAGLQPSTVNYHVQKLVEVGLVSTIRDGRAVRLHAKAAAA